MLTAQEVTHRTYEESLQLLNTVKMEAAALEKLRETRNYLNKDTVSEVRAQVNHFGYQIPELDSLKVIHVAGTKGKGSTSALCASILKECIVLNVTDGTTRPLKTGFLTSPHLITARERIRLDGIPVSEDLFCEAFSVVWERFSAHEKPEYKRFIFLMSLYVFFKYSTDVVILETGVGGEYDYTNVIEHPYATAITSLGVDHPWLLGETLTDIAWHKAGIIKPGVACFTAPQPEEAMMVLRERCFERGAGFPVSELLMRGELGENPLVELGDNDIAALKDISLGLKGSHQYINAAVAVATCKEWVAVYNKKHGDSQCLLSEEAIRRGLESATWPGRAQTIKFDAFPNTVFYLDGAHTPESLLVCSEWFRDVLAKEAARNDEKLVLIFNCTGPRSGHDLLLPIVENIQTPISHVIFCSDEVRSSAAVTDLVMKTQNKNRAGWESVSKGTFHGNATVDMFATINEALEVVSQLGQGTKTRVLVTGSLYLVGSVLKLCRAEIL